MWDEISGYVLTYFLGNALSGFSGTSTSVGGTSVGLGAILSGVGLWSIVIIVGALLCCIISANIACCCCVGGFTLGYSVGRGTPTEVPQAAAQAAALVGEAAAVATSRTSWAARERLRGYARDSRSVDVQVRHPGTG